MTAAAMAELAARHGHRLGRDLDRLGHRIGPHLPHLGAGWWALAAALVVLRLVVTGLHRAASEHGWHRLTWRWLTGAHMDGQARSDCGWWRPGRRAYGPAGHASPWATWPRMARAGVRHGGALAAVAVLLAWATVQAVAVVLLPVLGALAAVVAAWRVSRRVRRFRHRVQVVSPLAAALSVPLEAAPSVLGRGLVVPRKLEGRAEVIAPVPPAFQGTAGQLDSAARIVGQRLGDTWTAHLTRDPLAVIIARKPDPPKDAPFAELRARIEAAPRERILLGLAPDGLPRWWDRSCEDPHAAIHGGSRRGKTSLLLLIAAQEVYHGGSVVVVDPKTIGLMALECIGPAVELHNNPRDVGDMVAAIKRFRQLVEDRYDAMAADPTAEFPNALLIIDEVSQLSGMFADHWLETRPPKSSRRPAVWSDLAACVYMGAQCHAHVIVAGQRLDYAILGGMLGSFGLRLLAGYAPQDYNRLVGLSPYIRSQKPRGRFLLYDGDEPTWLQLAYAPPGELRDWLLEARQAERQRAADSVPVPPVRAPDVARDCPPGQGDTLAGVPLIVGLAAAAAHLGVTEANMKKARQRRPVPGEGVTPDGRPCWAAEALDEWRAARGASAGRAA